MIDGLVPYPEYKDSGLPWLPRLPASWSVVRNGRLFTQRNQTRHSDLPILEVSLRSGVRVRDLKDGGRKQVMSDRSKYKHARTGDLAYNTMRMWQGAVGVAPVDGLVSPAYVVARPAQDVNAYYLANLYRTAEYLREIDAFSRGIVKDRNRLYWEAFKQIPTPLPPRPEQEAIIRFLAHAESYVRRAIAAENAQIDRVEELRSCIVHHAVTTGSRSCRPAKVREVASIVNGFPFESARFSPTKGHPLIRIRDIGRSSTVSRFDGPFEVAARVEPGEVLIGMDGDFNIGRWLGAEPALLNQRVCCVRGREPWITDFLCYALAAPLRQINDVTYSTTVKHLASHQVERIVVALPAKDEAVEIIQLLDKTVADLGRAARHARRVISALRAFQSRLIADVVTGKLDVRERAAQLPEECRETGPVKYTSVLAEVDSDAEPEDTETVSEGALA